MDRHGVSVCISVYNTEKLLPRCLDSVVNQTIEDLEIVIVNDGSTDGSGIIIENYMNKYKNRRFVIINQKNSGLSNGRKRGVENATGEYIAFLDADDYVDLSAYERMYCFAKNNKVDIVETETKWGNKVVSSPYTDIIDAGEFLKAFFWCNPFIWPMLWLRMYSYSLFENKSPFTPLYCNNEDIFAFPCLLFAAHNIGFIKEPLHYYSVDNDNSIERGLPKDKTGKYYENRKVTLKAPQFIEEYIGDDIRAYKNEFDQYIQNIMVSFLHAHIYNVSYNEKYKDICEIMGFETKRDIIEFIKRNSKNKSMYSKSIRFFGIRISGVLRDLLR